MKICGKCGERYFKSPPEDKCTECGSKYINPLRQQLAYSLVDGGNRRAFNPEMNYFIERNH